MQSEYLCSLCQTWLLILCTFFFIWLFAVKHTITYLLVVLFMLHFIYSRWIKLFFRGRITLWLLKILIVFVRLHREIQMLQDVMLKITSFFVCSVLRLLSIYGMLDISTRVVTFFPFLGRSFRLHMFQNIWKALPHVLKLILPRKPP